MSLPSAGKLVLTLALAFTLPSAALLAQSQDTGAKQDMKSAGHSTKNAATDAGHGISKGTKKAYHKTKHTTKKAAHKVEGKQDTPANNPQ